MGYTHLTLKKLFALSGNECAFRDCTKPIFDTRLGIVIGQICHIKAKSRGGPRYDPRQRASERNGYENLILMCREHSKIIDDPATAAGYPVRVLRDLKHEHESKFLKSKPTEESLSYFAHAFSRPGVHPLIVGRTRHIEKLIEEYQEYEKDPAQRGRFIFIIGNEGIGKTVLVEHVIENLSRANKKLKIGRGRSATMWKKKEGFVPFVRILKTLRQTGNNRLLNRHCIDWLPVLRLHETSPYSKIPSPERSMSIAELKSQIQEFFRQLRLKGPILLFFDDLHSADESTLEVLAYLVARGEEVPVFVIATSRSLNVESHRLLADIVHDAKSRDLGIEIGLDVLSDTEVEGYLREAFPGIELDPLASIISSKSGRSPLLMVGLLNLIVGKEWIKQATGGWILKRKAKEFAEELPTTIGDLIRAIFSLHSRGDQTLLRATSMRGQHFEAAPVATALGYTAEEFKRRLSYINRVHPIIVSDGPIKILPDGTQAERYRFLHVTYQTWLYESMADFRKQTLSRDIAKAILEHYGKGNPAMYAELASLFKTATDYSSALDYYILAAEKEAKICARREAVAMARDGLECLRKLRENNLEVFEDREVELLNILGLSQMIVEGYAGDVTKTLQTGSELAEKLGNREVLFALKIGLWNCQLMTGELRRAEELATELIALAQELDSHEVRKFASYAMGVTQLQLGFVAQATEQLRLAEPGRKTKRTRHVLILRDDRIAKIGHRARIQWLSGYPDTAVKTIDEALWIAKEVGEPEGLAHAHWFAADIHALRRTPAEVQKHLDELFAIGHRYDLKPEIYWGRIWEGWIMAQRGDVEAAIQQIKENLKKCQQSGTRVGETKILALLAEIQMKSSNDGALDNAQENVFKGLQAAHRTGEQYFRPELCRVRGEILLKMRDHEEKAERWIKRACALAASSNSKSLELRATLSLSRHWLKQGRKKESERILGKALSWFYESVETDNADVKDAIDLITTAKQ